MNKSTIFISVEEEKSKFHFYQEFSDPLKPVLVNVCSQDDKMFDKLQECLSFLTDILESAYVYRIPKEKVQ